MTFRSIIIFSLTASSTACFRPPVYIPPAEEDTEATTGTTGSDPTTTVEGDDSGTTDISPSDDTADSSNTGGCPTAIFGQSRFGEACFG